MKLVVKICLYSSDGQFWKYQSVLGVMMLSQGETIITGWLFKSLMYGIQYVSSLRNSIAVGGIAYQLLSSLPVELTASSHAYYLTLVNLMSLSLMFTISISLFRSIFLFLSYSFSCSSWEETPLVKEHHIIKPQSKS